MNWQNFKDSLTRHSNAGLNFRYDENKSVNADYHITEIKQATIVSVDCGGVMNSWTEIIVQLWEPANIQTARVMKVEKGLAIVEQVERLLPLNPMGIVKIEFGNSRFDTRQMFPNSIEFNGEEITVDLRPDSVQCKASGRGDSCGTADTPELKPHKLAIVPSACAPGSGCC